MQLVLFHFELCEESFTTTTKYFYFLDFLKVFQFENIKELKFSELSYKNVIFSDLLAIYAKDLVKTSILLYATL